MEPASITIPTGASANSVLRLYSGCLMFVLLSTAATLRRPATAPRSRTEALDSAAVAVEATAHLAADDAAQQALQQHLLAEQQAAQLAHLNQHLAHLVSFPYCRNLVLSDLTWGLNRCIRNSSEPFRWLSSMHDVVCTWNCFSPFVV